MFTAQDVVNAIRVGAATAALQANVIRATESRTEIGDFPVLDFTLNFDEETGEGSITLTTHENGAYPFTLDTSAGLLDGENYQKLAGAALAVYADNQRTALQQA